MAEKNKSPRRLKKLESSDLLTIKNELDDYYVVTKQETVKVIREFVKNEIGNLPDELSEEQRNKISRDIKERMSGVEKSIKIRLSEMESELAAFIDYKFDELAEKACEMLLNRKFMEEVDKRAEQKLLQKQAKGKF